MASKKQKIVTWNLSKLKDHPSQAEMFGDVAEAELAALVDSMKLNGLQTPIEITPDGVIITTSIIVQPSRLAARTR